MSTLFEIKDIDRKVYEEELRDFLPEFLGTQVTWMDLRVSGSHGGLL